MEVNLGEILKHLPQAISSINTPLQLVGLVVIVVLLILVLMHRILPQNWVGPLAFLSIAGLFGIVGLVLWPAAKQISVESPTDTATTLQAPANAPQAIELLPVSSQRRLTDADITGMNAATIRIARNEIFARNQRHFRSADLQKHFSQFSWYQPDTWEPTLTSIESDNVAFLFQAEKSR